MINRLNKFVRLYMESELAARRPALEDLIKRKSIFIPSFQIYGGIAGLYDLGPIGCTLKNNIEQLWRNHFIIEEDMLEIMGSMLTIEPVLKASGHVDKFTDYMVKDKVNGECCRADKYLREFLQKVLEKEKKKKTLNNNFINEISDVMQKVDTYGKEDLKALFAKYKVKSPAGNDMSDPEEFNLMFSTQIGPTGGVKGYMRPETAQGMFVNFKNLLNYNNGKMPFAAAQIGFAFRNEISPRGLLRLREFTIAEIEHFVDPNNKSHAKFSQISSIQLPLLTAESQALTCQTIVLEVKEAVDKKIINNETLAYYMARTYLFLKLCGIPDKAIRFRQHTKKEMAHYASDCWDAEVECSYGWTEVIGHADRACFDLSNHSKVTGKDLCAANPLKEPIKSKVINIITNKKIIGSTYKKDAGSVMKYIEQITTEADKAKLKSQVKDDKLIVSVEGKEFALTKEMIEFKEEDTIVMEEKYIPHVIEPSFGIGRILYMVLEHSFRVRPEDKQRSYFIFPPIISPIKCSILPLTNNKDLFNEVAKLKKIMALHNLTSKVDDSGQTIGKRYARTDELGIPFAITIDFDTLKDQSVTMREINTMEQIRVPMAEACNIMISLSHNKITWEEQKKIFPIFKFKEDA